MYGQEEEVHSDDDEDSNIQDQPDRNSDTSFKGPMHELLYLTSKGRLIELYFKHGENLIYHFVTKILSHVVGKRKWNNMGSKKLMNVFVTNSDEAFAMLVMENNCFKWTDEFENPSIDRRLKVRAQWTETEDGCRNWSIDGMKRYMELYKALEKHKLQHKDRYKDVMETMKMMEIERTNNTNKRKKKDMDNNQVPDDNSNYQNDELEQFLME